MSKKISYANTVRRSTKLDIEEIPIIEWLVHHGLEKFYYTIFVEKHILYKWPSGEPYPYEYSHLLTNIKTNVDLLFSFHDGFKFKDAISIPVSRKLYEMNSLGQITQEQTMDKQYEYQFLKAFELLLSQKMEYKAMLSLFGRNPSKATYNEIIETNLDFLDTSNCKAKNIFKSVIIEKLKLISFDDLEHCNFSILRILLSLPIEEIQKFMVYTTNKLVHIKNGLKTSFTKSQFNRFIDNNESLKVFESCYNNYDLNYVNKSIKDKFNATSFSTAHRMELVPFIFNPDKQIDAKISDKIYTTFFPDEDHIYIDSQFKKIIKIIPHTIMNDKSLKKNNIRVFFIQGHGARVATTKYLSKPRVNFETVFANINEAQRKDYKKFYYKPHRYNANRFNIISTQPVGRKSIFAILILIIQIINSKYKKSFLLGLINANTIEHLRILENIVNMYWTNFCIDAGAGALVDEPLSEHLKKSKLKRLADDIRFNYFKKTDLTTTDIVNFVKYSYNYTPINTEFHFQTESVREGLIGVFELSEDTADDLIKLDNKIISKVSKDKKLHLGLKLNELYDYQGDIPENTDTILKYNRALKSKSTNVYTLEELMELIYLEGDIKPNEQVIIFDNACRGLRPPSPSPAKPLTGFDIGNTIDSLSDFGKSRTLFLRASSMENSLEALKTPGQQLGPRATTAGGSRKKRRNRKTKKKLKN